MEEKKERLKENKSENKIDKCIEKARKIILEPFKIISSIV